MRPWATVLRAPTGRGQVWMKAAGARTAFEVPLYELLAREVPERVLTPIAADVDRAWLLLPDGGPTLGEVDGADLTAAIAALAQYGRLQRALAPHAEDAAGARACRTCAGRDARALRRGAGRGGDGPTRGGSAARHVTALVRAPRRVAVPPSLDHNDLHPWNISAGSPRVIYDWGDSVSPTRSRHARAARLSRTPRRRAGGARPRCLPRRVRRPRARCRPGRDARARMPSGEDRRTLTWDRAIQAAREQGDAIDPDSATRRPRRSSGCSPPATSTECHSLPGSREVVVSNR